MDEGFSGGLTPFPPKWGGDLRGPANLSGAHTGREWAGRLQ
jgi:hypothetical protein